MHLVTIQSTRETHTHTHFVSGDAASLNGIKWAHHRICIKNILKYVNLNSYKRSTLSLYSHHSNVIVFKHSKAFANILEYLSTRTRIFHIILETLIYNILQYFTTFSDLLKDPIPFLYSLERSARFYKILKHLGRTFSQLLQNLTTFWNIFKPYRTIWKIL